MDFYQTGITLAENKIFPKCKALLFNNAGAAAATTIYLYKAGGTGGTYGTAYTAAASSCSILPIQCSSIGTIGANTTVSALY